MASALDKKQPDTIYEALKEIQRFISKVALAYKKLAPTVKRLVTDINTTFHPSMEHDAGESVKRTEGVPFKLVDSKREVRKGVVASSLEDLLARGESLLRLLITYSIQTQGLVVFV